MTLLLELTLMQLMTVVNNWPNLESCLERVSEKWPDAAKVIENFKISNADAAGMVAEVDLNGKSIEDTVAAWMDKQRHGLLG